MDVLERLRLPRADSSSTNKNISPSPQLKKREDLFNQLKRYMHRRVVDLIDLTKLGSVEKDGFKGECSTVLSSIIKEPSFELLNSAEKEKLIYEVCNEMLGLGPLEPLFSDDTITDILVNNPKEVYVERYGKLERCDVVFQDEHHLRQIIDRIVSAVGRRVDESSPMVDARLADGSRVNAILPPLALDGPVLSIRRFGANPITAKDLLQFNSVTEEVLAFLAACVKGKINMLVSGGTGSGKTTLLNVLSNYVPSNERIITIEDSAELRLQQEHIVRLETRPSNIEGKGEVTQRELVRNSLRMRPNRIVIGEVRGAEALDMLQAMNTGHEGSLSTIHANSPRDALTRLEVMCVLSGFDMPVHSIRYYTSSAINIVIQVARLSDGSRKVVSVTEITGMEGSTITMEEIFKFSVLEGSTTGRVRGMLKATGIRPRFIERIRGLGVEVSDEIFKICSIG
ncbi:MAG TPA: CpaF family protein [Candidatus Hypogeohydataceae bacterium YC41]